MDQRISVHEYRFKDIQFKVQKDKRMKENDKATDKCGASLNTPADA